MEKNNPRNAPRNSGTDTPLAVTRRAAGLTQQQLSDMLGVPFRTIQSWEVGDRKPPEYVERLIMEKLTRPRIERTVELLLAKLERDATEHPCEDVRKYAEALAEGIREHMGKSEA